MAETEAEQELDLDQMWIKAQVEFQRMFPGRDPRYLPVLRVEDVIGMISQKKEADEKAGAKYRVAKDVLNKTLKCIQNLGALAIQGASMVSPLFALLQTAIDLHDSPSNSITA